MAGHADRRTLLDLLSNELAYRSGLLLSARDLQDVAQHAPAYGSMLLGDLDDTISRVTDFYEDLARELRAAIGNLPDAQPAMIRRMPAMMEIARRGYDASIIMGEFVKVGVESGEPLGEAAVQEVVRRTGAPHDVVVQVFLMIADHFEREASIFGPPTFDWDGVRPLAELFGGEIAPRDPAAYIDQRFLDFLAARGERLDEIHWRNFERLCAEFFLRSGFRVHLGPGTADGGVDLRVWETEQDSAPFLLVQCKRFAQGNSVKLETVKALWSDVDFEGAEHGLIVTTSSIAPGGKHAAVARGFRLGFAENARVRKWARSMWRYAYDAPTRSMVPCSPME